MHLVTGHRRAAKCFPSETAYDFVSIKWQGSSFPGSDMNAGRFMIGVVEGNESLAFFDQKIQIHERFVADVLPANSSVGINDKCAVQRGFFEIVIAAVFLKNFHLRIGHQWKRKRRVEILRRSLQVHLLVSTDRDDTEPRIIDVVMFLCDGLELVCAMQTAVTQIKDDDDWSTMIVAQ